MGIDGISHHKSRYPWDICSYFETTIVVAWISFLVSLDSFLASLGSSHLWSIAPPFGPGGITTTVDSPSRRCFPSCPTPWRRLHSSTGICLRCRLQKQCRMVGGEFLMRNNGIKGTRPSTFETGPTWRMGVGEGLFNFTTRRVFIGPATAC